MKIKSEALSVSLHNDPVEDAHGGHLETSRNVFPVTTTAGTVTIDLNSEPEIKKWEDEEDVAARSRLRALRNPKFKAKKEHDPETWNAKTISRYLDPIPAFPVDDEGELDTDFAVPRQFLSNTFGGNCQQTFPTFAEEKQKNLENLGFADGQWACMVASYNPFMPTRPGFPGLFFRSGDMNDIEQLEVKTKAEGSERNRVFACLKPNQWLYVGQYDVSYTSFLSKQEWSQLGLKVQKTWARWVCDKDWGKKQRARILLRNQSEDREFSQAEFLRLFEDKTRKLKGGVTEEQVIESFNRGEEFILVYSMKCVGYEYDFQRKLVSEYPAWEKISSSSTKQKGNKRNRESDKDDKGAPKAKRVRTRRAPGVDGAEYKHYVSRGTKSRPRRTPKLA